jgi:hypothetical protein
MEKQIIYAKTSDEYLSDFMTELPVNCLFDKGKTGCGGTTIAIENKLDTIIAMPYVNVIKNKTEQHPNLLGIYQGVTDAEILDYLQNNEIKKIAVTYDRLESLINLLEQNGYKPYSQFYLLVDEWHILFNSYVFRNEAVKRVLFHSRKFDKVTYMTATPIEEEFILTELKDLPIVEVEWSDTINVNIKPIITTRPINEVCRLINDVHTGKMFGNLHFFVNSVDFIAEAIKKANLQPDQVRVICSNNTSPGKGRKSNQKKLGLDYPIATTTDPLKSINFYTSTCFEGCDIYDENGRTYIVSDKNKSHTLLDISTLIIQICGRIRDSHYKTEITHIFSETRYNNFTSYEEFKESSENEIQSTKKLIEEINNMSEESRKKNISLIFKDNKSGLNDIYLQQVGSKLAFDENRVKLDIVNCKITHHLYNARVTMKNEYQKYGFNVLAEEEVIYTDKLAANPKARISFKDLFEEYAKLKKDLPLYYLGNINDRIGLIEKEKPLVKEAFEVLGIEKVRSMNYNVSNIKKAMIKSSFDISTDSKIIRCLANAGLKQGITKSVNECKIILQDIYNTLELKEAYNKTKKAKATDLDHWFVVNKHSTKINGKTTDCITIVRTKMIFE